MYTHTGTSDFLKMSRKKIKFTQQNLKINDCFSVAFYISKIIGYFPFDFQAFRKSKKLLASSWGTAISAIILITTSVLMSVAVNTLASEGTELLNDTKRKFI